MKNWLHRCVYVHAHLLTIVRLYGRPERAGGQSLLGETYAARAARGDKTLLQDCLTVAIDALSALREEVELAIAKVEPTDAQPGTRAKVEAMARRVELGQAVFSDRDGLHQATGAA